MELKPGYKQTEIGVIPEDWDVKRLGECATFRTGPFGSALHKSDYITDGVPLVNPMHIVNGGIKPSSEASVTEEVASSLSDFRLKTGEIVIGRRGDMGRCAVVRTAQDGWLCGTGSMIIRCKEGVSADYLQRILASPSTIAVIEATSVGSTMINLNQHTLSGLRIALPRPREQEATASALNDLDELQRSLESLIAKKHDIKQAAMQELLTGKRRLPGFEGEWKEIQLADVATIRNAKVVASSMPPDTKCIELECIHQGTGRLLTSSHANGAATKYTFKRGDVLFGRLRAYLRKFWLASFDGICSTEIWPLIARENRLSAGFLHLLVQSNSFVDAAGVSYGTHMPRSDWSVLRKFQLKLPPMPEQVAIATVLADMDVELASLEARRNKTRALKQAMMQELLTGRIRLR